MLPPMRLSMHALDRWADPASRTDDTLAAWLVDVVRGAVARRGAPGSAVVVRAERVDILPLGQLRGSAVSVPRLIAGLSRSELPGAGEVQAVGVVGTFVRRGRPGEPGVPVATVFLEWPDNRWWHWSALVDADGDGLIPDTDEVRAAVEGDPKPASLGGWWSLARRRGVQLRITPEQPAVVH